MNVVSYSINTLKGLYDSVEVGQHLDLSLCISIFITARDLSFNFDDCLSLSFLSSAQTLRFCPENLKFLYSN